jgi:hypothetical protein
MAAFADAKGAKFALPLKLPEAPAKDSEPPDTPSHVPSNR